jgi:hypothetical protein
MDPDCSVAGASLESITFGAARWLQDGEKANDALTTQVNARLQ